MSRKALSAAPQLNREVVAYKSMLADILALRPSGTRQRLARLLNRNPSFVSQITSPLYDTPIPAQHVPVILEACHVSKSERETFMALYVRAHPRHFAVLEGGPRRQTHTIELPDFGSPQKNRKALQLVSAFVRDLTALMGK